MGVENNGSHFDLLDGGHEDRVGDHGEEHPDTVAKEGVPLGAMLGRFHRQLPPAVVVARASKMVLAGDTTDQSGTEQTGQHNLRKKYFLKF